ncbi:MAG: hypothetical protein ACREJ2_06695 [Planctomycetota bacterium]
MTAERTAGMVSNNASVRIVLSAATPPPVAAAADRLSEALRCDTLRPCRVVRVESLGEHDWRFDGLTLLTDPAQLARFAVEGADPALLETGAGGEADRIVIRHLRTPLGLCVLAWGTSTSSAQRALAIIGEYLGLRVFPWGRVVVPSHDERELVNADVVLQARFATRGLAPVRMTDRRTWGPADIEAYMDFAAWNGYNLVAWPVRLGSRTAPVCAGAANFESAALDVGDNGPCALAAARARGLRFAAVFDPLDLPPAIIDAAPPADLHPGGLAIQPFSETGQRLYRQLAARLCAAWHPDAVVLSMSGLTWRPEGRPEVGRTPDALAFRAQLLAIYGPEAVSPETELYLQAGAALAEAARFLELDLPVIVAGRRLAGLTAQQHQVLPENAWLCPAPAGDLVALADRITRDAAHGVPVFFDHLTSLHRPVWGALTVDETFLGDSPRVRSLDTILGAWLKVPMQGMLLRHARLHGCDENLLYTAQAIWGEIPSAKMFYAELSSALYGAAADTLARARQGQEEIEAVSSVHDEALAREQSRSPAAGSVSGHHPPTASPLAPPASGTPSLPAAPTAVSTAAAADDESFSLETTALDDDTLPAAASLNAAAAALGAAAAFPSGGPVRSLRRIVAELIDRMPLAREALPAESYLLSFLRDLSSHNIRLAGILQAVEGSLARRDLLTDVQGKRIERAVGRLTAKLEMGRFARAVMSAALLCRQAADPELNGGGFGRIPTVAGATMLHQALTTLRRSPPERIVEVLAGEHGCDREATQQVVEETLVEPWRQLVARLERALGPQLAGRLAVGTPSDPIDLRRSGN